MDAYIWIGVREGLVAADVFFTDFLFPNLVFILMGFLVILKHVGIGTKCLACTPRVTVVYL